MSVLDVARVETAQRPTAIQLKQTWLDKLVTWWSPTRGLGRLHSRVRHDAAMNLVPSIYAYGRVL